MIIDPISLILILAFFLPILKGFLMSYRSNDQKDTINKLLSSISFTLAIFIGIKFFKSIVLKSDFIKGLELDWLFNSELFKFINKNQTMMYLVVMPLIVFIIYMILKWVAIGIFSIILYPIFDIIEKFSRNRSSISRRILGAIFKIPRAIAYIIIICLIFNYLSTFNLLKDKIDLNSYLEKSELYDTVSKKILVPISNSDIAKNLPNILSDSFKIETSEIKNTIPTKSNSNKKVIVYYNGVTLEEAIKSNEEIDNFSKKLTENKVGKYNKSYAIYSWISSNITYDYDKAKRILNNDFSKKSGAISSFYSKEGICFDYSTLFVVMCRANNIKTRIITGKGFDGRSWVNHSWNQVYIEDKKQWINVDTTFGIGGKYFNNEKFDLDHKESKIAGEW